MLVASNERAIAAENCPAYNSSVFNRPPVASGTHSTAPASVSQNVTSSATDQMGATALAGIIHSQKVGGTGDIFVKKRVQWSQNYVLTGPSKLGPAIILVILLS